MDIAIVTGAETPLGLRIIERLIQQGCRVHGIGNNFSKVSYADPNFIAHAIDLTDLSAICSVAEQILEQEGKLNILIHAIDVTPGSDFSKLAIGNLEAILKIGLLGPVMLTRIMLPNLLRFRGQLINIIPANKSGHHASAVNALIEGGLRDMNQALFDSARDAGLRVSNLILRQNPETPAETASPEQVAQSRIDPANVVKVIISLLDENETNIPNEITLYPRLSATAEQALPATPIAIDPYSTVVLPPKEYRPPEPEPIATRKADRVERVIPYTDEEMEDKIAAAIEDYEAHPERYDDEVPQSSPQKAGPAEAGEGGQGKNKRRRRRRGRNRNRERNEDNSSGENAEAPSEAASGDHAPRSEAPAQPAPEAASDNTAQSETAEAAPGKSKSRRRRGGRNRNREKSEGGSDKPKETPEAPASKPSSDGAAKEKPSKAPAPAAAVEAPTPVVKPAVEKTASPESGSPDKDKPVKKKAAKKAAKKKTATKKAAKKAVKKKAAKKKAAKKAASKEAPSE